MNNITESKLSDGQLVEIVDSHSAAYAMKVDLEGLTLIADAQYHAGHKAHGQFHPTMCHAHRQRHQPTANRSSQDQYAVDRE